MVSALVVAGVVGAVAYLGFVIDVQEGTVLWNVTLPGPWYLVLASGAVWFAGEFYTGMHEPRE